ncbi:hypothetical protein [Pseudobacteroides cellulosolvens]|uniref:Uncharacterized protein n=1 Tax=Pseudobacteroides cellulosolvens ATCC 35603 = DSM 2933 TaxID=398512 RepID=A0A0L6JWV9_9FIRM|nr:hypothetical protein [Pseudobacteroides cellulosolvens]KNY30204.1 hypothetical protein Bccel_5481 [Pseudobacteroides cellulosolvens ATCC 35603 = DSM 2933]
MIKFNGNSGLEAHFNEFLNCRINDIQSHLLQDPEYIKINNQSIELFAQISSQIPKSLASAYEENETVLLSKESEFCYLQGFNDGPKFKFLLGMSQKDTNALDMTTRNFEEIYANIDRILKNNADYKEAKQKLHKYFSKIDKEIASELSDINTCLEVECQEAGYNQGFSDAVRLITNCLL